MFYSKADQVRYIKENYPEVTDSRINDAHWGLYCPQCKRECGFQVVDMSEGRTATNYHGTYSVDDYAPIALYFRCPVCKAYKQWVMFNIYDVEDVDGKKKQVVRYYRVASLPSEGIEDVEEIPADPPSLRVAYKQAIRSMDANAYIAAAAMFRRALQIITRDILGATPGNLANELKEVEGKKFEGGTISANFSQVSYVIKEAGNQGAHPDQDQDLLDFSQQDAEDLQKMFMELITDMFIIPKVAEKAKEDFLKRRKIESKSQ